MTPAPRPPLAVRVVKIGGSLLTDLSAYRRAAVAVARAAGEADRRIVVVVSAELGATDALLATARTLAGEPDSRTLDLLWSTGELRSVALLTLALQSCGVGAVGLGVHETGLAADDGDQAEGGLRLNALRLRAALAAHPVVVVPGFLATAEAGRVVSLGRGGSDLTAVVIAARLGADRCELVKDVPGYFTADPHRDASATRVARLDVARAIAMADGGCELVQRAALEYAGRAGLRLVVRALDAAAGGTVVRTRHRRGPHPALDVTR